MELFVYVRSCSFFVLASTPRRKIAGRAHLGAPAFVNVRALFPARKTKIRELAPLLTSAP